MEVKELKDALAFAMSLHMAYDKAKADGKLDVTDLGLLVDPMMKLMPAIEGAKAIPAELKDMSDDERKELCEYAKAQYDIADDKVEGMVEQGLALVLHVAQFVGLFVKVEDNGEEPAEEAKA